MRLIVGLGNPGPEYEATWHNIGFMAIDKLVERSSGGRFRNEAEARVLETQLAGQRVLLVKPQTYMNLSGNAVRPLMEKYGEGNPDSLLVISDDVNLPIGMIRIRPKGSAGGQKGLDSIIQRIGSQQFARVRIGIKPDHPVADIRDFVLSAVPKRRRTDVGQALEKAADAIEVVLKEGVQQAMARFNQRVGSGEAPA